MNINQLSVILEAARYVGVFVGLFIAFSHAGHPVEQLNILAPWVAISLCGLTGLESLICANKGVSTVGYEANPEYQRQSGLNNLSVAIAAALAYLLDWGLYANAAVLTVVLSFFALSGINHMWSYVREGNKRSKNLSRPFASFALVAAILPFIIRALKAG